VRWPNPAGRTSPITGSVAGATPEYVSAQWPARNDATPPAVHRCCCRSIRRIGSRLWSTTDSQLARRAGALHAVRGKPRRLICAVPVATSDALAKIRPHADEIVCLQTPDFFYAVGQFYRDFRQVDDCEVVGVRYAAIFTPPA
jgi:hypothetical protein